MNPAICRQEQARLQAELTALDAAHAARVADMEALTAGSSRVSALTVHYDKVCKLRAHGLQSVLRLHT